MADFTEPRLPALSALTSIGSRAVVRRNWDTWRSYALGSLVGSLGEPLLYILAIGIGLGQFIGEDIGGQPYLVFMAPAILAAGAMNGATFETTYSSYTRLAIQKTFDAIVTTPVSVKEVVAAEIVWGMMKSMISGMAMFFIFGLFGLIQTPLVLAAVPVLMVLGFLFASLGMLATSFAQSYNFFTFYFTLFISPMFLFSGTFFPLEGLPGWAQSLAWCLPLTHGVRLVRPFFHGEIPPTLWGDSLWLLTVSVVLYLLVLRRMERRMIL